MILDRDSPSRVREVRRQCPADDSAPGIASTLISGDPPLPFACPAFLDLAGGTTLHSRKRHNAIFEPEYSCHVLVRPTYYKYGTRSDFLAQGGWVALIESLQYSRLPSVYRSGWLSRRASP